MILSSVILLTVGSFTASILIAVSALAGGSEGTTCPLPTPGYPFNAPRVLSADARVSPNNSLIVNIEVSVDTESRVYVEYENPGAGRFRSRTTDSLDTIHTISVVRLRPSTTYCYQVFAQDADGRVSPGLLGTFTTDQLPDKLQVTSFTLVQGRPSYPLTLMDITVPGSKGMVMLDSQANIVWYFQHDEDPIGAIAQKPNGNLVYQEWTVGIKEITPLGEEVNRLDKLCDFPESSRGGWHHEAYLRPGDRVLLLGHEIHDVTEILGNSLQFQESDTIEEWDQNTGEVQVLFDIFDFIPVTDRTERSNVEGTTKRHFCSDQEFENVGDWTHANSLFVAPRGNIIMSIRHLNQIISIAPDFQSIEWRLGGPGGQFDFPKPGDRFYQQHSAVELPNGNILLFDNGNTRPPVDGGEYSRALELELDLETMTATKVWEYRHAPDLFSWCCSNVTRLPGGNTLINFFSLVHTLVEADNKGNAVAVIQREGLGASYRAQPIYSIYGESVLPVTSTPTLTPTPTLVPVVTPKPTVVAPVQDPQVMILIQLETTNTGAVIEDEAGNLTLVTSEQQVDLGGDVGQISVSIDVDLLKFPEDASLSVKVQEKPIPDARASFVLAATNSGTEIVDTAFTIVVEGTNVSNETDLGEARIRIKVSEAWVEAHGGAGNIRIFRYDDDGRVEILETLIIGRDTEGNFIFKGISPNGLSVFALIALEAAPPVPLPAGGAIRAYAPGATTTLTSPDGRVMTMIPANAVAGTAFFLYEPRAAADSPAPAPAGLAFATTIFDLTILDLAGVPVPDARFRTRITISVKYTDEDILAAEGNPSRLAIHRYDSVFNSWTPLGTTFDPVTKTVHTRVSRLGFFALMGQEAPPTPTPTAPATLVPGAPTLTPAITATAVAISTMTPTALPPAPGDVAPGSRLLLTLLIAAGILIAAGGYYLRQTNQA